MERVWTIHKRQRKRVISLLREAKAYFTHLSDANPKKFWSTVYFESKGVALIPVIHHENDITHSKSLIFLTLSLLVVSTLLSSLWSLVTFLFVALSMTLYYEALKVFLDSLASKATGPDGISGRMLKSTASSIATSLRMLFNICLSTSTIPSEWSVVPVWKYALCVKLSNYIYAP